MVDFDILDSVGTTNERLREVLTAVRPENYDSLSLDEQKEITVKVDARARLEKEFRGKLLEHVTLSLKNHYLYSAVDLAWSAPPITPGNYPLILYAQGKIKATACAKQLADLKCGDEFVKKDEKGQVIDIDLPKFFEVSVNLVRSMVLRRLAAQSNKYNNLYPHFRYDPRGTSTMAKMRADMVSQRMDIMADDYDYKHHEVQVARDTLLYAHSVDFPRSAWERDKEWVRKQNPSDLPDEASDAPIEYETKIAREGVVFVNPHPSRVFWDNASPLSSINADIGSEYLGFWDIKRWGEVKNNPQYFNREKVAYSNGMFDLISVYQNYFEQYHCTIKAPEPIASLSSFNDRKNNIGVYGSEMEDTSIFVTEFFKKMVPKEYGIGNYPYPIWCRFTLAGDSTPVYSEIYPSRPACYMGLNENDSCQVNLSFAMQLMPYQDQMSNLFSQLLMVCKNSQLKIVLIDTDLLTPESLKEVLSSLKSENYYERPIGVTYSGNTSREMGFNVERTPVRIMETAERGQVIQILFQAMAQLLSTVERLESMSPNESGQPNPREVTATEVNSISNTTMGVYSFISDAIDEYRAAKKRICFESWMACGANEIRLPVLGRYSDEVVKKAGFTSAKDDDEGYFDSNTPRNPRTRTVIGSKNKLLYDYIFTNRDGAERPSNSAAAQVLVQLLSGVIAPDPEVRQAIGKEKLFELINETVRLTSNFDLGLELREGEPNSFQPAMPEGAPGSSGAPGPPPGGQQPVPFPAPAAG